MTTPRRAGRAAIRRGFSLLEVQAAFLILGFSVAALFPFAVAQYRLVAALERRLPPGVSFALVSRDHKMVNLLVSGASSTGATSTTSPAASEGPGPAGSVVSSSTTRAVVIESVVVDGGMGGNDMTATVVVKVPPGGGQE